MMGGMAAGRWCFVARTQVVVGIEQLPPDVAQGALEVGPANGARTLSAAICMGASPA